MFTCRRLLATLTSLVVLSLLLPALANAATLTAMRVVQQETVRLHLDADVGLAGVELSLLEAPHRLVIDLPPLELAPGVLDIDRSGGLIAGVRHGLQADGHLRVVIDLRRAIEPSYRLVGRRLGERLVVDLGVAGRPELARREWRERQAAPLRDVVVAIDAGHGGKDPGAIGPNATREKDVVLAIASRLYKHLVAHRGVTPVMTRDSDEYVPLRARLARARVRHADVFVSLHADAFHRREAAGSSVYALSRSGATSEAARWLANSENEQAALFGEVVLGGRNAHVASTLLDLAQSTTLESSLQLAGEVLTELGQVGKLHKRKVEQAGFAVLTSPDMPSILVETAFISNPEEERKLSDPGYVDRLARAISDGVVRHVTRHPPEGTVLHASRERAFAARD